MLVGWGFRWKFCGRLSALYCYKKRKEETADHFHHIINNVHLNLKFEIEKPETTPSGLLLSLLDFKVIISKDGNSSFEFYKKPAKKPLFVHHQSAIPTKSKLNFIRNERKRIKDRCSSNISTKQHLNTFDGILHLNGYPEKGIEQTKRPQNPQQTLNLPTQNGHTLRSLTYLNDSITGSLTFFEKKRKKKTSQYALPTNPTRSRSDKPYPTLPRSANALETNALSLTPDCVYEEMQCTSSRVTAAISNTFVVRHASSATA